MATGDEKDKIKETNTDSLSFAQKLAKEATVTWQTLGKAIEETYNAQVELNKAFGQGQERLSETYKAVSDAAPRVARLGGDMKDVQDTMIGIADASRRNVIANTEDVEKLYAATQVVGGSAAELSNSFLDIGVGIEQIPKQLENSVNYIRSIGGNTKAVMADVAKNMDQMNRYQFEGGVVGLTKMAAQASMLRFDMNQTFQLADKVLDPENAIEVASAFQRLGVASGALADPFQLMNMSINDPSGLQDSLADVAKQFTYFDEKTKTFKINPQGVLTLREMEKQTGVSAAEMSKMGLAAAELDQRLSAINMAGLTLASEEDKQYLANIATMQDGKYMVTLEDGTKKELAELTQPEFDKLIEEQKTGPKTLEDIAKLQLGIDEDILANIKGMRVAFEQGITSPKQIRQGIAATQRVTKTTLGAASDEFGKSKDYRDVSEGVITTLGDAITELKNGNKSYSEIFTSGLDKLGNTFLNAEEVFTKKLENLGEKISQNLSTKTEVKKTIEEKASNMVESYRGNPNVAKIGAINSPSSNRGEILQKDNSSNPQTVNSNVNVGGKIEIDLKTPMGVSTEKAKQMIDSAFNGSEFQNYINNLTSPNNLKEPTSKTFGK
jgi:hypothetical protein